MQNVLEVAVLGESASQETYLLTSQSDHRYKREGLETGSRATMNPTLPRETIRVSMGCRLSKIDIKLCFNFYLTLINISMPPMYKYATYI